MSATSVFPYFLISALLLAVGGAVAWTSPFYRHLLDAEVTSARFHPIDGLRGFLALGVFFHHAAVSYFFYQTDEWLVPPSRFYTLIGQVSVLLFFMITAFLFWTKGLKEKPYLDAHRMFWSRLCRLTPMYFFSVMCVFVVAAVLSEFEFREPLPRLVRELVSWLSFGFLDWEDINGVPRSMSINAGVQWTLVYEWLFYFFLPIGLIFAKGIGFAALTLIAAVTIAMSEPPQVEWGFVFGALAAVITTNYNIIPPRIWQARSTSFLVCALIVVIFVNFERGYGLAQGALALVVLTCIANGNTVFGLLTSRAARLLGAVSYSIYLMHGIVLFIGLHWVKSQFPDLLGDPPHFWTIIAACGVAVVLVSTITYRFVEHPFLKVPEPRWLRRP